VADVEQWSSDGEKDSAPDRTNERDGVRPARRADVRARERRAVEIGVEAECFDANLVVMPPGRRGPAARVAELVRRLFAARPPSELAAPRV
jgi:hypothetical protein